MSKDTTTITMKSGETKTERKGVLPGLVHLALDVAERGQSTAVATLQDARVELRTAIDHGIELAEKLATGAFRFSRKLVQKVDDAAADTLQGVERVLGHAIKSARETTLAAQELASTAASSVAGKQAA
jgi:hypothetical protein